MPSCTISRVVQASPQTTWNTIGGFLGISEWLPFASSVESMDGGTLRRVTTVDGEAIVERLIEFEHDVKKQSYAIVESPFPVSGYLATLRVFPIENADDLSEVVWSARFQVTSGASEDETVQTFETIFRDGLDALAKEFGG